MMLKPTWSVRGSSTIADVARASGFSPMTVSRVINGEKNVKESTRSSVLRAASVLNYSPNIAARTLAGAEQIRIGLVYSNPSAAYLSRFMLGSLEQARLSHLQLVIEKCDFNEQDEASVLREIVAMGVDGVIISPPLCDSSSILHILTDVGMPVVAVANWRPPMNISVVRIDDRAAAAAMTNHILSLGHRKIGFIAGNQEHKASEQRLLGYQDAICASGVELHEEYIVKGEFTYRSGLLAAEALLDLPDRPTAIFAGNDDMAAAVIAVAHRRQIEVPADLTVCGYDDTDFALSIWPELTTIHQPIAQMAQTAVTLLVKHIREGRAGQFFKPQEVMLDFTMMLRESDGRVRTDTINGLCDVHVYF